MIGGWKGLLVSAAIGGVVAFAVGARIGSDSARAACERQFAQVKAKAADLIQQQINLKVLAESERDQARGEVQKVNDATALQVRALQKTLLSDRKAREDAALRIENAAKIAADEARQALARADLARKVVEDAVDPCALAPVPDDVRGVLNALLSSP
jgi:hypothetical protein